MSLNKVLQLSSNVGFFGAESVILELTKQLSSTKYKPIVGVFNNARNPHLELVEIAQQHNIETKIFPCNGRFDIKTAIEISKFVKNNQIRIIHTHGYKTNLYAGVASLFEKVPLVVTCHPWLKTSPILKFYAWLDKRFLHRFDKIIAISDEVKTEILREKKIAKCKVTIIDNGIDVQRFNESFDNGQLRREFDIDSDAQVIGTIGRLSSEKGHAIFIEAAKLLVANYPKLFFVVVGDGPLKESLQRQSADLGLQKNILFTGVRRDIPKMLALMDIFVLPSLTEGLPMVLLEAMAAKKPIVATNVGQIPSIIEQNESGILVTPNNSNNLKEAIAALLNHKDKAVSLAQNAFAKVAGEFSSEAMAGKYIEIYEEILKKSFN